MMNMPSDGVISVGRIFDEAKRQGIAPVVLRPDTDDANSVDVDGAARKRIAEALKEGYVVITPERPVVFGESTRIGWWLVDPETGTTFDQLDDGRGATLPEWAGIALFIACYGIGFIQLGLFSSMTSWLAGERAPPYQVGTYIENWVKLNVGCLFGVPVPQIPGEG